MVLYEHTVNKDYNLFEFCTIEMRHRIELKLCPTIRPKCNKDHRSATVSTRFGPVYHNSHQRAQKSYR